MTRSLNKIAGLGGGGRGHTRLLLALVILPLTTHPFRGGAPFPPLIKTPQTFGCSLRFFHVLHINCLLMLSRSCFAFFDHHLSPRIAIVFSLLSGLPNSPISHPSNFFVSRTNTSRSSLYISQSPTFAVPHRHMCVSTSSSSRPLVYIFLLSGRAKF